MSDKIYICPTCNNSRMEDTKLFGEKMLENFRNKIFSTGDPHKFNYKKEHYPLSNELICFGSRCSDYGKKMTKFEYELIRDKHPIEPEILDEYKPKKEEILEDPFKCKHCNKRIENHGARAMHERKCERIHTGAITEEDLMIE